MAAGRKELLQCGRGNLTDRHLAQQTHIFAIIVLAIEVLCDCLFQEDVSRRCINLLLTTYQSK